MGSRLSSFSFFLLPICTQNTSHVATVCSLPNRRAMHRQPLNLACMRHACHDAMYYGMPKLAKDLGRAFRAAKNNIHEGQLELPVPGAAEVWAKMACPEALVLYTLLERPEERVPGGVLDVIPVSRTHTHTCNAIASTEQRGGVGSLRGRLSTSVRSRHRMPLCIGSCVARGNTRGRVGGLQREAVFPWWRFVQDDVIRACAARVCACSWP